jgi:hypothetical protein
VRYWILALVTVTGCATPPLRGSKDVCHTLLSVAPTQRDTFDVMRDTIGRQPCAYWISDTLSRRSFFGETQ